MAWYLTNLCRIDILFGLGLSLTYTTISAYPKTYDVSSTSGPIYYATLAFTLVCLVQSLRLHVGYAPSLTSTSPCLWWLSLSSRNSRSPSHTPLFYSSSMPSTMFSFSSRCSASSNLGEFTVMTRIRKVSNSVRLPCAGSYPSQTFCFINPVNDILTISEST